VIARLAAIGLLLFASSGFAQVLPERELEFVRAQFDAGKYAETIALVRKVISVTNFTDAQRIELHRMAGLSAFNLGDLTSARESFASLLRLNPDYVLDPFVAPPPAIRLFDQLRKDNAEELGLVRQLLQVRAEQERRRLEEEARRKAADLGPKKTVVIERRPMWVNLLPFGVGQFSQDRVGMGVTFAVTEGVLAAASAVAFWALELLKVKFEETVNDVLTSTGSFERSFWAIPVSKTFERDVWRVVKWSTGGAFVVAYAIGAIEATLRHQGDRVTETPAPAKAQLFLTPLPGGAAAGLNVTF
jgi:tetratricopeptide (TPR) repeat protein